jgi:hypothetical protein
VELVWGDLSVVTNVVHCAILSSRRS